MRVVSLLLGLSAGVLPAQRDNLGRLGLHRERSLAAREARMNTDERIAWYQRMAASEPRNVEYQNRLTAAYLQKLRETTDNSYLDRATKIVDRVLELENTNYEALRLRSEIELQKHNFAKVAEHSRHLTQVAPNDPWNWGTLGDSLMELGDYDGAAEAYQKMAALNPNLASYNRVAYYRFVTGDAEGAISIMQKAIAMGSSMPENVAWCLVDLGNMYFKAGKLAEAEASYSAAVRTFPGYHPAFAGLGRVQAAQNKIQEAIETYRRAQAVTPLAEYAAALEMLYEHLGLNEQARKQSDLIDVIDKLSQANNEKTNRNLALIYADRDRKLVRALELAQAELEVRKDVYTYDALAWILYKNKNYAGAEKAMRQALKLGTPEPSFHYHAGVIAASLGKTSEATAELERAVRLNPRFDLSQAAALQDTLKRLPPAR